MYWPPNIDGVRWFINEVFPIIREARSDVVFDIIGARPPQDLERLNNKGYGVNVMGYIEEPSVYLERAAVMVVPLRAGGGMRVKILNALSQGLPIVTTKIGCEGIAVKSGNHLLVADSSCDFAQATLSLLNDQVMAKELGNNGRRLVEEQYDYRIACRPLDRIYTEI
jgi:glycosyltransferase involved in cell wall biosynthesis